MKAFIDVGLAVILIAGCFGVFDMTRTLVKATPELRARVMSAYIVCISGVLIVTAYGILILWKAK